MLHSPPGILSLPAGGHRDCSNTKLFPRGYDQNTCSRSVLKIWPRIKRIERIDGYRSKDGDNLNLLTHLLRLVTLSHGRLVSQHWKAVIDNSQKLQKALFLSPAPPRCALEWESVRGKGEWRPFIQKQPNTTATRQYPIVTVHPSIEHRNDAWFMTATDLKLNQEKLLGLHSPLWRSIYITQPPVRSIESARNKGLSVIEDDGGITISHLLDAIDENVDLDKIHARTL